MSLRKVVFGAFAVVLLCAAGTASARYLQSDPLLQPNRALTEEWAFFVPVLLEWPRWLHPYAYVTSQPLTESDRLGLGPLGIIKCVWLGRKLQKYNDLCRGQCPDDMQEQIKFMEAYRAVSVSDALLKCTCVQAELAGEKDLCANWMATCITSEIPTPRKP